MAKFVGRLQSPTLDPTFVEIEIADERFRIVAGRRHLGSWSLSSIKAERTSVYRFSLTVDDDQLDFFPEDPSGFSDAVGAVIDLRETPGRFGLKARMERAAGN